MKPIIKSLFFSCLVIISGCSKSNNMTTATTTTTITPPVVSSSSKKGVCLAEGAGYGVTQVSELGLGWYYDYGITTNFQSTQEFIPMVFSLKNVNNVSTAKTIIGFNEPDNVNQSNITVADAISNWPIIVNKATRIGSPATAGDPLSTNSWLSSFMMQKPKVDFITVHWYKGVDPNKFISDITAIIAAYNLPVWITEYAPQTVAESTSSPDKYTQAQVTAFINTTTSWMNSQVMVERYAWHDSKVGTSAIFTAQGDLTITGQSYRDAK